MSELFYSQHSNRTLFKNTGFKMRKFLFRNRVSKIYPLWGGR